MREGGEGRREKERRLATQSAIHSHHIHVFQEICRVPRVLAKKGVVSELRVSQEVRNTCTPVKLFFVLGFVFRMTSYVPHVHG